MTQPTALEAAKQGNPQALAALMNHSLKSKGITAKVVLQNGILQVRLESAQPPDPSLAQFVKSGMEKLKPKLIENLRVSGWQIGSDFPEWSEEFQLADSVVETKDEPPSIESPAKPAAESQAAPVNPAAATFVFFVIVGIAIWMVTVVIGYIFNRPKEPEYTAVIERVPDGRRFIRINTQQDINKAQCKALLDKYWTATGGKGQVVVSKPSKQTDGLQPFCVDNIRNSERDIRENLLD